MTQLEQKMMQLQKIYQILNSPKFYNIPYVEQEKYKQMYNYLKNEIVAMQNNANNTMGNGMMSNGMGNNSMMNNGMMNNAMMNNAMMGNNMMSNNMMGNGMNAMMNNGMANNSTMGNTYMLNNNNNNNNMGGNVATNNPYQNNTNMGIGLNNMDNNINNTNIDNIVSNNNNDNLNTLAEDISLLTVAEIEAFLNDYKLQKMESKKDEIIPSLELAIVKSNIDLLTRNKKAIWYNKKIESYVYDYGKTNKEELIKFFKTKIDEIETVPEISSRVNKKLTSIFNNKFTLVMDSFKDDILELIQIVDGERKKYLDGYNDVVDYIINHINEIVTEEKDAKKGEWYITKFIKEVNVIVFDNINNSIYKELEFYKGKSVEETKLIKLYDEKIDDDYYISFANDDVVYLVTDEINKIK